MTLHYIVFLSKFKRKRVFFFFFFDENEYNRLYTSGSPSTCIYGNPKNAQIFQMIHLLNFLQLLYL